jgi:uncharacterized membrane protein YqgA involved in biofilm formation
MRGLGTLINLATVAAGALIGLAAGERLPQRMRETIMQGLGLVTVAVGVVGFQPLFHEDAGLKRFVIVIASVIAGGLIGEALRLEDRLESAGERLRRRVGAKGGTTHGHSRFVEGFVIASTVFCVGPLTVLGSVEDGLGISIRLLTIKSALDGFAAIGFASVYGAGVLGSLLTVAIVQGLLTAGAFAIEPVATAEVLAQLGATGSLLILGIALRLLDLVHVRVVNLLPALPLAVITAGVVEKLYD